MAKHRSFKIDKFLGSVESELRAQYFSHHTIFIPSTLNFDDDSFDDFWDGIDEAKRVEIEEELHCINDTADQARDCLENACREFKIQKEDDETSETTAMRVFLHSEDAFSLAFDAYLYYVMSEKLSHHKFQNVSPNFSDVKVERFKAAVEQHFKDCGKSDNCAIRKRQDGSKHVFFIARGDHMKTHLVFDDQQGKPGIKSFRPAKEDMLVFDTRNNILSLNLSGRNDDDKKKYLEMFGQAFLGLTEIDDSTLNNSLIDLDPIKRRTFNFGGNEHIEAVKLTEVNARLRGGGLRLVLRSHDLSGIQGYGIGADGTAEFTSVKLKFLMKREGRKSKTITVEIRPPESSKIPQKKEKQIIEQYLHDQGVLLESPVAIASAQTA